jgi:hypothetical protein
VSENAELHADFKSVKKVFKKMHQNKVISKTSLTNISKSAKSKYLCHVFANNFFMENFLKTFSKNLKSA